MDKETLLMEYVKPYVDNPSAVSKWYIYRVHHIDETMFFNDARKFLSDYPDAFDFISAIRARMKANWWEGDGRLGWLWLPPFCFRGDVGTVGDVIWHVKQSNNGTSFIVSRKELYADGLQGIDITA